MKLKSRLDKLEPATRERWLGKWRELMALWDTHMSNEMLDRFISTVDKCKQHGERYEDALEATIEALDDWGLVAWDDLWSSPDLEGRDYHVTPETIPPPPEEPEGAHAKLTGLMQNPGLEGDAASVLLYALAMARAVREYHARH